jgi:hypothetical protein
MEPVGNSESSSMVRLEASFPESEPVYQDLLSDFPELFKTQPIVLMQESPQKKLSTIEKNSDFLSPTENKLVPELNLIDLESLDGEKNQTDIVDVEDCEQPLPVPQPVVSPKRFDLFLETLRLRISSPKSKQKNTTRSKLYSFLESKPPERFKELTQFVEKIEVKQIAQLKYYKDLPTIAEPIALCYLHLFSMPIPKNRYWSSFLAFLAQPGLVIQRFRQLPEVLDSKSFDLTALGKVKEILEKIPKAELKLGRNLTELQMLIDLLRKILQIVVVPELPQKSRSMAHIPQSRLMKTAIVNFEEMEDGALSRCTDDNTLKAAIDQEHKTVKILNGKLSKEIWNEKRFLRKENEKELQRDEVRELEIQKNTVFDS